MDGGRLPLPEHGSSSGTAAGRSAQAGGMTSAPFGPSIFVRVKRILGLGRLRLRGPYGVQNKFTLAANLRWLICRPHGEVDFLYQLPTISLGGVKAKFGRVLCETLRCRCLTRCAQADVQIAPDPTRAHARSEAQWPTLFPLGRLQLSDVVQREFHTHPSQPGSMSR